jgi:hypothetical protein
MKRKLTEKQKEEIYEAFEMNQKRSNAAKKAHKTRLKNKTKRSKAAFKAHETRKKVAFILKDLIELTSRKRSA